MWVYLRTPFGTLCISLHVVINNACLECERNNLPLYNKYYHVGAPQGCNYVSLLLCLCRVNNYCSVFGINLEIDGQFTLNISIFPVLQEKPQTRQAAAEEFAKVSKTISPSSK